METHRVRDFESNPSIDKALNHAVPLYLYVSQDYAHHIHYDSTRVGSHKDIFPTLYELSLSNIQYSIAWRIFNPQLQEDSH